MKKSHILVISQYFYPESFRINDICQEWVKRGYKVTVVTGIPNYPDGKFYQGYGYLKKRTEKWNGIKVLRLPLIARGKTAIGLILNYLSFAASGFLWSCITDIEADYVFTYEVSPMTQALLGVWYKKKHKAFNYLYVQDLWPENVEIITGIHSPVIIKPIRKMVDYIYKNCDEIFVTSPSFKREVCKRKISQKKVHYWPQYAEDFYKPLEYKPIPEIPEEDVFKIIFTGNIGYVQGLDVLPKTAQLLEKYRVKFYIVGEGRYKETFKNEIKRMGVQHKFIMIPGQPADKIPELLSACDVAFLSFQNAELWSMTIPAKLQSYMACGMPIVASAKGETERIISESGCGICCDIGNAEELSKAIKEIMKADLDDIGKKSRKYFETHFDKRMLMDQIEFYFK